MTVRRLLLALCLAATSGCGVKNPPEPVAAASGPAAPTYFHDVKPVLDQHCLGCHVAGGIAPFSLEQPSVAAQKASLIAQVTGNRTMPPWPPDADCNHYLNDTSLSEAQIATLQSWAAAGAPLGQPEAAAPALTPAPSDFHAAMGRPPDQVVAVAQPYTPSTPSPAQNDDYHCFVFDPGLTEDKFITAANVLPGNQSVVHHVILFAVDPDHLAKLQQLDDAEPGPGYTCFGDARVSSDWVDSWAPGRSGDVFPAGTGIKVKAGSKLVMQVHYNLNNGRGQSDASQVELYYARPQETANIQPAYMLPIPQPVFEIPAGDDHYEVGFSYTVKQGEAAKVWAVGGHMHLLGTEWRMWVSPQGSARNTTCLLELPRWDFHWQGVYFLKDPVQVNVGDVLNMRCTYDNSAAHQPYVNGEKQQPRSVGWGEETTSEMCLGLLYVTQ